jgi:hypothetical protein
MQRNIWPQLPNKLPLSSAVILPDPCHTAYTVSPLLNRDGSCKKLDFEPKQVYAASIASVRRLHGLVVRVPGYTTEMYCASCEVRTEFIYVM